jgi:hypothetical protein
MDIRQKIIAKRIRLWVQFYKKLKLAVNSGNMLSLALKENLDH